MKKPINKFKRDLINLGIIVLIFIANTPYIKLSLVDSLEHMLADIRLQLSLTGGIDNRVVIADIDEASISALGRWPWDRDLLATLTDTLFEHYQIKVLGFDILFAEPNDNSALQVLAKLDASDLTDPRYPLISAQLKQQMAFDTIFADALSERNIVLGMVFDQHDQMKLNTLPKSLQHLSEDQAQQLQVAKPKGYTANIDILNDSANNAGFFDNPNINQEGLNRKVPLIQLYQNDLYPALSLAVTRKALNDVDLYIKIEQAGHYRAIEQLQLGNLIIPVDETGSVPVPYRGPAGSFRYFSVKDLLNKSIAQEQLAGRIVLLGTSAPGLQDLRATPVDTAMPGVEIHANLITGMLDQRITYAPSYILGVELLLIILLGFLMGWLCRKLSPLKIVFFTASLILIYLVINGLLWKQGIILFLASPLLLILSIFVVHMSWGFIAENQLKRTVTQLFGQYVPAKIVAEMIEKPELVTLEGQSRELTVLFADIRGFTTISEQLSPQELSQFLNQFLTPLTKIIYDNNGTIDKYIGDCIMAFWGAPVPIEHHANHAINAALHMLNRIALLQQEFQNKGWPPVNIGIGINTGLVSVGNMGSEYRMAYTVLGDAVNLAARLEGLSKHYGVALIVSEFTKSAAPNFVYQQLDKVKVKGKNKAVTIYQVVGQINQVNIEILRDIEQFQQALDYFYQQNWGSAQHILENLAHQHVDRPVAVLYQTYLQRISQYQQSPPDEHWDGVFSYLKK